MADLPTIDPALGIDLVAGRTLTATAASVTVVIPAHNEESTVASVVRDCLRGLEQLAVPGEVIVSASGCTDDTAARARSAGAQVVLSPLGKGAAVAEGIKHAESDVICLVDGDIEYYGEEPLVAILVRPILRGIVDATITDLYWRPLYPQMWLHAFFAPLAGFVFPELLPKCGSTPWSGQRAATKQLWPVDLPNDFTVDLAILLHWNEYALRLRPIVADDWVNPQRPKADLMPKELEVLIAQAVRSRRLESDAVQAVRAWFRTAYDLMASYRPGIDDPQAFERHLLLNSRRELHHELDLAVRREVER